MPFSASSPAVPAGLEWKRMSAPSKETDRKPDVTGPTDGEQSDEALLLAIGKMRDRGAFVTLFERYAARVKAYLMRGGTPESTAEDAAQEVMIAVWRRAELFNPARAGAATWIFTIARNKRIDLHRREARGLPEPDDPTLNTGPEPDAHNQFSAEERDAQVRAAIQGLSEDQRQVVRLSFFSELSHAEIAGELGLPLGTVKSRLRLAFERLRTSLGSDFWTELIDD